jgi:hypothetical protein
MGDEAGVQWTDAQRGDLYFWRGHVAISLGHGRSAPFWAVFLVAIVCNFCCCHCGGGGCVFMYLCVYVCLCVVSQSLTRQWTSHVGSPGVHGGYGCTSGSAHHNQTPTCACICTASFAFPHIASRSN